jgi:hypothetical protein
VSRASGRSFLVAHDVPFLMHSGTYSFFGVTRCLSLMAGGGGIGPTPGHFGLEGRLAKAHAAARVRGLTPQLGGRADLLLVGTEQEDEQRLRAAVRQRGGLRLRGHDSADGEEVGSCLRIH